MKLNKKKFVKERVFAFTISCDRFSEGSIEVTKYGKITSWYNGSLSNTLSQIKARIRYMPFHKKFWFTYKKAQKLGYHFSYEKKI